VSVRRPPGLLALALVACSAAACVTPPTAGDAPPVAPRAAVRPDTTAQRPMARRYIAGVGDSTFVFPVRELEWVRPGMVGRAVDPARRDTLVAMFRVLDVFGGLATALVTGQTTDITTDHVALLEYPTPAPPRRTRWYRLRSFWVGLLLGGGIGAATAVATR
jgi:hypothetical protein